MDELNLFINYNLKYIVSISDRGASLLCTCPMLTVVSPAMLLVAAVSFAPTCYVIHLIESYQSFSKLNPFQMLINGTLILLYFPLCTVSTANSIRD